MHSDSKPFRSGRSFIRSSGDLLMAWHVSACVILGGTALASAVAQSPLPDRLVWTTTAACARPQRVRIVITHHDAAVYRGTVSLCRQPQSERQAATQAPRVSKFSFVGKPRELAPTGSDQSQQISGRLWEASAETDSVRVGVSFATAGLVLLNTTHPVSPVIVSRNTLGVGLNISSEPNPRKDALER